MIITDYKETKGKIYHRMIVIQSPVTSNPPPNPPPPSHCRSGKPGDWSEKEHYQLNTARHSLHTLYTAVQNTNNIMMAGGTLQLQVDAELRNSSNLHKLHLSFQHSLHGVHSEHFLLVNSVLVYQLNVVSQQEHNLGLLCASGEHY